MNRGSWLIFRLRIPLVEGEAFGDKERTLSKRTFGDVIRDFGPVVTGTMKLSPDGSFLSYSSILMLGRTFQSRSTCLRRTRPSIQMCILSQKRVRSG